MSSDYKLTGTVDIYRYFSYRLGLLVDVTQCMRDFIERVIHSAYDLAKWEVW